MQARRLRPTGEQALANGWENEACSSVDGLQNVQDH